MKRLLWSELLYTQGFGTRRICVGLIEQGHLQTPKNDGWNVIQDPASWVDAEPGMRFRVLGEEWTYQSPAYLVLNKPVGTECSHKPGRWPSVYSLLPSPLRQRPNSGAVPGVQAVGRLDQDTTGLLLFSDDGVFIHRMASPKHHVAKVYQVVCAHPVTPKHIDQLMSGVLCTGERQVWRASAARITGPVSLELILTEGKYHQVKRMLAAVGNPVMQLHRSRMGQFDLPSDLAPGQWRWLSPEDLARVVAKNG